MQVLFFLYPSLFVSMLQIKLCFKKKIFLAQWHFHLTKCTFAMMRTCTWAPAAHGSTRHLRKLREWWSSTAVSSTLTLKSKEGRKSSIWIMQEWAPSARTKHTHVYFCICVYIPWFYSSGYNHEQVYLPQRNSSKYLLKMVTYLLTFDIENYIHIYYIAWL